MKKMLLGLMAAMMVLTGCGSKQSAGELLEIDLTAKMFSSDKVGIADEIESIEYIPLELTDESLIANVFPTSISLFILPGRKAFCSLTGKESLSVLSQRQGMVREKSHRLYRSPSMKKTAFFVLTSIFLPRSTLLTANLLKR